MTEENAPTVPNYIGLKILAWLAAAISLILAVVTFESVTTVGTIFFVVAGGLCITGFRELGKQEQKAMVARNKWLTEHKPQPPLS